MMRKRGWRIRRWGKKLYLHIFGEGPADSEVGQTYFLHFMKGCPEMGHRADQNLCLHLLHIYIMVNGRGRQEAGQILYLHLLHMCGWCFERK